MEEDYENFIEVVDLLKDYFEIEEKEVIKIILNTVDGKKKIVEHKRAEAIKALCFKWNTKRRKELNAEKNK